MGDGGVQPIVLSTRGGRHTMGACDRRAEVCASLLWNTPVDLDLHCFYRLTHAAIGVPPDEGPLRRLKRALMGPRTDGHVFWKRRGSETARPWIQLTPDAGKAGGGEGAREERLTFFNLERIGHALIVANIFAKPWNNFAEYDGVVRIQAKEAQITVPLTESNMGSWCVVARIDNTGVVPELINVNETFKRIPSVDQFLEG